MVKFKIRKKFLNVLRSRFKEGDYFWFPKTVTKFGGVLLSAYFNKIFVGPVNVIVAPSWKCNSKCKMCDFHSRVKKNEFTTEEFKNIVDQVSKLNCSIFSFFGGEPLLRKDIFELIEYIKSKKLLVQISTNAILLSNENFAEKLMKTDLDIITVSLDCMDKELYSKIRGNDAFDKAVSGIKNIVGLKNKLGTSTQITVNTVIIDDNIDQIFEIIDFIKDFGIDVVTPYPVHELETKENTQSKHFNQKLIEVYEKMLRDTDPKIDLSKEYMRYIIGRLRGKAKRIKCFAPISDLHIDPYGNVYTCVYFMGMNRPIGNIRNKSIKKLWYSSHYKNVRKRLSKCKKCDSMCHIESSLVFNKFWFK